jgi:hypothetical protein
MSNISQINRSEPESETPRGPTFRRTRKGSEELVTRRMNLDADQRQVLLFANGKRSVEELTDRVDGIRSNPDLLFDMEAEGLIEMFDPDLNDVVESRGASTESGPGKAGTQERAAPAPRDELGEAKRDIEADLYELLGRDANKAVARLQEVESAEDLGQLLPKLEQLAKLSGGVKAGERFGSKYARWMK